ncbi:hypothetical protein JTB14_028017 [Gonioctena quinquepunctata]|nr:hypothetical protein JTB14_028017 [Gonioctena quinquepunctata]
MGDLVVFTVVFMFAMAVTSALDSYDVIPSCAKALLWTKSDQNYYDDSLKSIYENEAVSHEEVMEQIRSKIEGDDKFDIKPFNECINDPNNSTNEWFDGYGSCRNNLSDDSKVYVQDYVTRSPTDGGEGITKAVDDFDEDNKCIEGDEDKPECVNLFQFVECMKEELYKAEN